MRQAVTFRDFRQIVRRYRPPDLLPRLAKLACDMGEPPYDVQRLRLISPWAIALVARESILWGNEFRRPDVTDDALRTVFNAFNNLDEDVDSSPNVAYSLLTRIAYEQFPYHESLFEEVSRVQAMLVEGLGDIDAEVLSDRAWNELLGASIGHTVGATFLLQVGANNNQGWFRRDFLDNPGMQAVYGLWPRDVVERRLDDLTCSFGEFRTAYNAAPRPARGMEKYSYNPLTSNPFVMMPNGERLAPQPRLILRTVTPGGLYYKGIKRWGEPFARDLGKLTERYVGLQLRGLDGARVLGEVTYTYGKQKIKSVDWFLILPNLVVMFEVKSSRLGLLGRAAVEGFEEGVRTVLGKAVGQLIRTDEALSMGRQEFEGIPADRRRIGIVITAEPYYLANTPWVRELIQKATFPTLTASLRELEQLVTLSLGDLERQLLEIVDDPERSTWNLANALNHAKVGSRNHILDRSWRKYPWPDI